MIEVRNEGRCPQAVAVEQRLEPLLPAALVSAAAPLNDVAVVDERGDGSLTLSLSRPDGTLLGRRRLPRAATCADQADTVAVTLAVWEAEIHPELALRLDRLPATGRSAPPAPRALPAPSLASVEAPRAAPAPPAAAIAAPAPITATPAAIPWHFGLGVALGAGAAPTSPGPFAPTARVDLTSARGDGRWRSRLSAVGVGERTMAVAPGQVGWRRLYFTLALERELVRFPGGRWAIVVGGGPTLGVVSVSGSGFPVDRSTTSADAGVELGARLERAFAGGRLRGWLAATTVVWLRRQEVAIIGADPSVPEQTLPRVEPVAVLGVTVFPGW